MPSRPTVIALLALFVALGGTATAARLINGSKIRKGTVTTKQVKDRTLTTRDLSRSAIASLRRRLDGVTGARIVDGTITGSDLAPNSVGTPQVVDRSLVAGDIAAEAISANELGVGSVGDSELAENSVGNAEIKGNSISRNLLRDNVVGSEEVADGQLRAVDVGRLAGTAEDLDFGEVATEDCEQIDVPAAVGIGAIVLVGAPADLPDDLLVSGRSPTGEELRIQVCNPTNASVTVPPADFPFVVIAP